jgi:hypothetical protein
MTTDLLKKLRISPRARALALNPPPGYLESLGISAHAAPDGSGPYDFVQVFAKDSKEFFTLVPLAAKAVTFDGLFWLSYPKKSGKLASDLSRDIIWELMKAMDSGLRPVTQISIDETWSALRFRPVEKVGQ